MKEQLRTKPFFVFLLPLFFVFHGFATYFPYLSISSILPLTGIYLAVALLLFLSIRLLLKNNIKAGLLTVFVLAFFFFFGSIFDWLKAHPSVRFLYKYSFLLSCFGVLVIALFFYLRKTSKQFYRGTFFLNFLLIFYLLFDIGVVGYKIVKHAPLTRDENNPVLNNPRPDIYLLLFDEYSGKIALKNWFDYDNSALDSFLLSKNFFVASAPASNYEHTPFSMASMLNMDYLPWYKPGTIPTREETIKCGTLIRNNKVTDFLQAAGYEIVNLSIFDLANHPAPINQRFLAVNTRLITEETLLARICVDFEWVLQKNALLRKLLPLRTREDDIKNIETCHQLTIREAIRKSAKPKFVYTHLLVPHLPNLFDHNGHHNKKVVTNDTPEPQRIAGYLDYLQFANKMISELVTSIQQQTDNQSVILVMSDHGFRWTKDPALDHLTNNNINAVFLPGNQYANWSDSVTNVNQFRILFNTIFSQHYPLLKDSSVIMGRQ